MPKIVSKYVECYIYFKEDEKYKFLLLKRSPNKEPFPGIWQIVTGRIEKNEKAYQTAIREIKEEVNIKIKKLFVLPKTSAFYTMHSDCIHLIPLFLAESKNRKVKLSIEHTNYKWVSFKTALKTIHWYDQKENLKMINKILNNKHLFNSLVKVNII